MIAVLSAAVAARGHATVAFSGGTTAAPLLTALSDKKIPWRSVHVFQVDERVAPDGDRERNQTVLHRELLDRVPVRPEQLHPMPVLDIDLERAATRYAQLLEELSGQPPRLDPVHLGLGEDGHTA